VAVEKRIIPDARVLGPFLGFDRVIADKGKAAIDIHPDPVERVRDRVASDGDRTGGRDPPSRSPIDEEPRDLPGTIGDGDVMAIFEIDRDGPAVL